jgi:hypothetical protein
MRLVLIIKSRLILVMCEVGMSTKNEQRAVILSADEHVAVMAGDKTQHRIISAKSLDELLDDDIDFVMFDDEGRRNVHLYSCPVGEFGDQFVPLGVKGMHSLESLPLKITGIRIENLQDISHKDAVAEGVHHFEISARLRDQELSVAQIVFSRHWDVVHPDNDWDSNPMVLVIEFEKVIADEH